MDQLSNGGWLPVVFLGLIGIAMLAYVVLDGYDLGVGILLRSASDEHKDVMIFMKDQITYFFHSLSLPLHDRYKDQAPGVAEVILPD